MGAIDTHGSLMATLHASSAKVTRLGRADKATRETRQRRALCFTGGVHSWRGAGGARRLTSAFALLVLCTWLTGALPAVAATIPEDRSDALFHAYDGGGVTITGPSILVRKGIGDKVSVYGNYYVDFVSSASIDVVTQGSKYSEERTEYSAGVDYLQDKTTLSVGATVSRESDYEADTAHLGVSQSFFGDLTTISMGYSHGIDDVYQNLPGGGRDYKGQNKRDRFSLGLTQILSKNLISALNIETVVDDGEQLNNPYRQIRWTNSEDGSLGRDPERYPATRNSDALAIKALYYLPYRASVRLEGRYFSDSWSIEGQQVELRYTHPYQAKYVFEFKLRSYVQSQAYFYQDLVDYADGIPEFLARDKELSDFKSINFGIGVTYDLQHTWRFINKQTLSFYFDFMRFDYENFRDMRLSMADDAPFAPGEEPAYSLNANVIRMFYSAYY